MQTELLRRYALALALVPDADVAGDLFMDARDEHDLRRRAFAWRRALGFPELAQDPPLPALTAAEQEHALHLARRGRQRRQLRRFGLVGAGVITVAAVLVGGAYWTSRSVTPPMPAWAADGVFTGKPATFATSNEVTLRVYRVDATAGKITVWWSADGAGTIKNWNSLTPVAALSNGTGGDGVQPERSETVRIGREKVLGRSIYRFFTVGAHVALVRLDRVGTREAGTQVSVELSRVDQDPEAKGYKVPVPPDLQGTLIPDTLTIGTNYVALTSAVFGRPDFNPLSGVALSAGDKYLRYLASEKPAPGKQVDYFEAPPPGTSTVQVTSGLGMYKVDPYPVDLPGDIPGAVHVVQRGSDPVLVLTIDPHATAGFSFPGTAEDANGHRYDLTVSPANVPRTGRPITEFLVDVKGAPVGTRLVRATLTRFELIIAPQFQVVLTAKP